MTDVVHLHIEHLTRARYPAPTLRERERVLRTLPSDPLALTRETTQAWWEARQTLPAASKDPQHPSHRRPATSAASTDGPCNKVSPIATRPTGSPTSARSDQPPPRPRGRPAPTRAERTRRHAPCHRPRSNGRTQVRRDSHDRMGRPRPGNGVLWVREGKGQQGRSVPCLPASWPSSVRRERSDHRTHPDRQGPFAVDRALHANPRVDYTAHKLRARYATRFLAATGDLKAAADALGHSDLSRHQQVRRRLIGHHARGAEAAGRIG